ncbi:MAG: foldase protein PrsA [Streptomyces sp.]|jgi:peptidyl-prolyl cis-trans isomerase C|nr:foldase protein PrsA [Streptomyces sp.]
MRLALLTTLPTALTRLLVRARREPVVPGGRKTRIAGAALLAVVAVGSGTAVTLEQINGVPEGAAFRVAGTAVTTEQFDERVRLLGALYGVQPPTDPGKLDQFRRDTAKAVAVSDVLDRVSADEGIVIADKAANDELTRVLQTSYPKGRDDFTEKLGQLGLSEQIVLDEVKRQMANSQLYDKTTKDVPLATDDDVIAAFNDRRDQMATPEKRHLRNIVVGSEDDAKKVRAQLEGGADFVTVARASSLDKSTKDQGGELGTVTRDQLERGYGDAAFGAPANGLFGPVQTQFGWNVGQVLAVTASTPLPLDQVRDPLRTRLTDERKSQVWNDWLAKRIADAHVRYADAYRPADPDDSSEPTR